MKYIIIATCLVLLSGCKTLLPSGKEIGNSKWRSYDHVSRVFNSIENNNTTISDLAVLGVNMKTAPNVNRLTYLDVMARFNLDSTVFSGVTLPPGIENALNNHERCTAYEINISNTTRERVGSFWKDLLGFEQVTKTTGWVFKALIVLDGDVVIYVLHSGTPKMEQTIRNKKPLGPFQSIDGGQILEAIDGF